MGFVQAQTVGWWRVALPSPGIIKRIESTHSHLAHLSTPASANTTRARQNETKFEPISVNPRFWPIRSSPLRPSMSIEAFFPKARSILTLRGENHHRPTLRDPCCPFLHP
jgi:hypothetical protein